MMSLILVGDRKGMRSTLREDIDGVFSSFFSVFVWEIHGLTGKRLFELCDVSIVFCLSVSSTKFMRQALVSVMTFS
jgi:hypothetical protein